jgi:molecular chaperone DnaK
LAKDEVTKMVADAASHEAEDKKHRELIETRNKAENLAYQMEKLLRDNKAKLSAETVKLVEDGIAGVHKLKESEDEAALKTAVQTLEAASHKAAEELYKSAGPTPGAPGGDGGAPSTPNNEPQAEKPKGEVVDAEFRQA